MRLLECSYGLCMLDGLRLATTNEKERPRSQTNPEPSTQTKTPENSPKTPPKQPQHSQKKTPNPPKPWSQDTYFSDWGSSGMKAQTLKIPKPYPPISRNLGCPPPPPPPLLCQQASIGIIVPPCDNPYLRTGSIRGSIPTLNPKPSCG